MNTHADRRPIHTGTDYLLGYAEGAVAVLSFNRPESRNALHDEMYFGFGEALPTIAADPSIGCLVITGEGTAFCAGGDVKSFANAAPSGNAAPGENGAAGAASKPANSRSAAPGRSIESRTDGLRKIQNMVVPVLATFPKVTIAALPGAAAGAGLSIALACDLRVASDKAIITTAFAKIGASGDFGGSYHLTQLVGAAKAKELYLLSDRVDAQEAHRLGIVNRVFAHESFDAEWRAMAAALANGPTVAHRYIKENINRAANGASLQTALDAEAYNMMLTMSSEDHFEASKAFVQKRPPKFTGR